jgi:hypothetical protein
MLQEAELKLFRRYKISKLTRVLLGEARREEDIPIVWAIDLSWLKGAIEKKYKDIRICRQERDLHHPRTFHKFFFEKKPSFVVPVRPTRLNERVIKQQGLFLGACNIEEAFEENLRSVANNDGKVLESKIHTLLLSRHQKKGLPRVTKNEH